MTIRRLSTLLLVACTFFFHPFANAQLQVVGDGGPGPVKAQHLTAELAPLSPGIDPRRTLQVGLVLTLEEHWHVYWINAGVSGEPPKITWTLPEPITAGPMQFPIPSRLPLGPLMDFGYEDEVAFPVQLTAASSLKPGPIHLDAIVNWLVCREVCIPGKAHLGLNLTVSPGATAPTQPVGALGEALNLIPKPLPPDAKLTITGGIILNLMPCVFPVLFLKGLALLQSSGQQRKHLRSHGLVYTLGILVSFWIIVAVLLALRAGGSQAGWGFQLQSPVFLTLLAAGIFF